MLPPLLCKGVFEIIVEIIATNYCDPSIGEIIALENNTLEI